MKAVFPVLAGERQILQVTLRYVAQVQISSVLENSVRLAAMDITDTVLEFLPDANDMVKAAEYSDLTSSIEK